MTPKIVPYSEQLDVATVAPSTARWHTVEVLGPGDNPAGVVPVAALAGQRPHPCLAVVGGMHGDEYDGIRACQEIAQGMDVGQLKGTLLVVPVANLFAFAAARRRTPDEMVKVHELMGITDG